MCDVQVFLAGVEGAGVGADSHSPASGPSLTDHFAGVGSGIGAVETMPRSAAHTSAKRRTRLVLSTLGLALDFPDRSFVTRGESKNSCTRSTVISATGVVSPISSI